MSLFTDEQIAEAERENVVLQIAKLVCNWDNIQYAALRDGYMTGFYSVKEFKEIVAKRLIKVLEPVRKIEAESEVRG